MHWQNWLHEIE